MDKLNGLLMARTPAQSRNYLIGGGVVYLVLWIYGLVIDQDSSANFVPVNNADNWLHLILGVGMIGLGVALSRRTTDRNGAVTQRKGNKAPLALRVFRPPSNAVLPEDGMMA